MRHPVSVLFLTFTLPIAALLWPILLGSVFVPFFGFFALPSVASCTLYLLYGFTWLAYLVLLPSPAASHQPGSHVKLPWSPKRCYRVNKVLWRHLKEVYRLRVGSLIIDWCYRRILILGNNSKRNLTGADDAGSAASKLVKENIDYGSCFGNKRLDVYYPLLRRRRNETAFSGSPSGVAGDAKRRNLDAGGDVPFDDGAAAAAHALVPVIVFIPGGGWTSFADKRHYLQLALSLRKKGLAVVIPDITLYPEGTVKEMVIDIRRVLAWTNRNIAQYGGDRHNIHLMGHGSGAHLALLTVVQEAVVRSRDSFWLSSYTKQQQLLSASQGSFTGERRGESGYPEGQERDFATMGEEGSDVGIGSDFVQADDSSRQHRLHHTSGEIEISAGIRRLEIWGENESSVPPGRPTSASSNEERSATGGREGLFTTNSPSKKTARMTGAGRPIQTSTSSSKDMPKIKGMILLAGISDVIKHIRFEFKQSIEELSQTRNALGVTHANCLMTSPSHLLFGAKQIIDTSFLPSHFLLIHGGADRDVPIVQTVLLKTLLQGIGLENVQLRAYRDLSHIECVTALMQAGGSSNGGGAAKGRAAAGGSAGRSKYSNVILGEILAMVHEAEDAK